MVNCACTKRGGLIAPQSRTEAGYRQYGTETLDRLKAIMHLKELGFTLAEIALLLSDRDHGVLDEQLAPAAPTPSPAAQPLQRPKPTAQAAAFVSRAAPSSPTTM